LLLYISYLNHYVVYYHNTLLGFQQSIQFPMSTAVTTNTQSLLSSDQQHPTMSHSKYKLLGLGIPAMSAHYFI